MSTLIASIVLVAWVHSIGCPPPNVAGHIIGEQNDVVLVYSNGETVAFHLADMTDQAIADLTRYISKVKGYTYVAKCKEIYE